MNIFREPVLLIAFGFGAGLSPKAPGTAGTLVAIPLFCLLATLPSAAYLAVVALAALAGIPICGDAARRFGVHDHQGIVWDEIVGYWITMALVPVSPTSLVLGFVLFRAFDIFKPWPIRWADRHVGGGLGIMLDDILAGIAAWVVLQLLLQSGWL